MKIFSDLHFTAPHEMFYDLFKENPEEVIITGDCVDIVNCDKKHCSYAHRLIKLLKERFGDRYIFGNHESMHGTMYFIHNGVYYTHGHLECWPEKKVEKWLHKKHCTMKAWKKPFYKAKDKYRKYFKSFSGKPSDEISDKMALAAQRQGCHTYICGHRHPAERIEYLHKGIKIIILPRGMTEL